MPRPLARRPRRVWMPLRQHLMRQRAEALAQLRKRRAGTYAPATHKKGS